MASKAEPQIVLERRVLFAEGLWNGIFYSAEELEKAVPALQEKPPYAVNIQRNSLFYDHDDDGKTWLGEVPPESVEFDDELKAIVGDVAVVDEAAARKVEYQQARNDSKFGISPRVEITRVNRDNRPIAIDIDIRSWAAVVEPAQGQIAMLSQATPGAVQSYAPIVLKSHDKTTPNSESIMEETLAKKLVESLEKISKNQDAVLSLLTEPKAKAEAEKADLAAKRQEELAAKVESTNEALAKLTELLSKDGEGDAPTLDTKLKEVKDLISELLPFWSVPRVDTGQLTDDEATRYSAVMGKVDEALLDGVDFTTAMIREHGPSVMLGATPLEFFFSKHPEQMPKGRSEKSLAQQVADDVVARIEKKNAKDEPTADPKADTKDDPKPEAKDLSKDKPEAKDDDDKTTFTKAELEAVKKEAGEKAVKDLKESAPTRRRGVVAPRRPSKGNTRKEGAALNIDAEKYDALDPTAKFKTVLQAQLRPGDVPEELLLDGEDGE